MCLIHNKNLCGRLCTVVLYVFTSVIRTSSLEPFVLDSEYGCTTDHLCLNQTALVVLYVFYSLTRINSESFVWYSGCTMSHLFGHQT